MGGTSGILIGRDVDETSIRSDSREGSEYGVRAGKSSGKVQNKLERLRVNLGRQIWVYPVLGQVLVY